MDDISILFSGGSDSTLAALYALKKADRVHLLTFRHSLMGKPSKRHLKVIEELRKLYGAKRIIDHEGTTDELFRKFYMTGFSSRILRYGSFYIPWLCGACKMAMHVSTMKYNRRHGILTTYDGANIESSPYFPAQTRSYMNIMADLYQSYGMKYESPVYLISGSDKETERFGLVATKDTKKKTVFPPTQHLCFVGVLVHIHSRLYYRLFRGPKKMERLAEEQLRSMISNCKNIIDQELNSP